MLINKQLKQPQYGSKESNELGKQRGPDMQHSSGESTVHRSPNKISTTRVDNRRLWMFFYTPDKMAVALQKVRLFCIV